MEDLLNTLLFKTDPSSEQREALRERLKNDPATAEAWAHWQRVRLFLRDRLEERLSDRRLLVLYVLEQEGKGEALAEAERAALAEAREDIDRALRDLPALEQIVERIREECVAFEETWDARVGEEIEGRRRAADANGRGRTDRAPRSPQSRRSSGLVRWTRGLAAAALVVAVAAAAVLFWPSEPSVTTVTAERGTVRTVPLEDGSTVRLVGAATLAYPASPDADGPRQVTLRNGRAFFDVPDRTDDRPFVVETPTAVARVLGTQFGVTTAADTTEVVLASGAVRVRSAEGADEDGVVLSPGQKSWVVKGEAPSAPTSTDLTSALEWTGLFVFRSVPLSSIAERLHREYGVQIEVADALAEEPITGTFERDQPVREVLDALALTLGAEVQRDGGRYRIVPSR